MATKINKRGNGEGNIRQKPGGSWEARYSIGFDANGKQLQKSMSGKTRAEVVKKLQADLTARSTGLHIEPVKLTVGAWLDIWFNEYKMPVLKAKSLQGYETIIRLYLKPVIGNIEIQALRGEHIQKMYNNLSKRLSVRTTRYTHTTLHAALKQAVKNDIIIKNYSECTTLPKQGKIHRRVLTANEQMTFEKALEGERFKAAFILDLYAGLRVAEIVGLKWKDIDFENQTLRVSRILHRVKNFDPAIKTKTILKFETPKTNTSQRVIPLIDEVIDELKAHKSMQFKERLKAGAAWQNNNLIFCNELGGNYDPGYLPKHLKKVLKRAGLKTANFHALRHTYATRALESGMNMKVVSDILGHSTLAQTADTYSHVLIETKREEMNKLKAVFARNA